jgi:NADH dehydrogenase [ubiquinone] 1 alpha subcomplex assembly factor 7
MTHALMDRLKAMIRASGPISVATYMDLCLHDRQQGYYATRPGLGQDFITAPETSQVFGELIGLWAAHEWQQMGAPAAFNLIEIGPGRGTLMADALRATRSVAGFHAAMSVTFVEASPLLRSQLGDRFSTIAPQFVPDLAAIPTDRPFLLIANEWLDCLPVQQYVRVGTAWHERVIGLSETDALSFGLQSDALPVEFAANDAAAVEIQPALKTLTETLAGLYAKVAGRALFIDYGPANATPADTLRSYRAGQQIAPLAAPGQGLRVDGPRAQGQFLLSLGAEARLNQLAQQNPAQAEALYAGVKSLVDPAEMGTRFQAISVAPSAMKAATGL